MSLDLEEETPSGSSTSVAKDDKLVPMDLLDEYWFFHNTLNPRRLPPRPSPSPNKGKESGAGASIQLQTRLASPPEKPSEDSRLAPRRPLLTTPSPPPPRVGPDEAGRGEVAVPSESTNPKLRHSFSSLDDRHRPQSSSSSKRIMTSIPSISRRRQPRDIRVVEGINKYTANQCYLIQEANYRKAFQEKKWKSLSDLEFIEVQGFKDLGFVFDEQESSSNLANVIPGLRDRKAGEGDDKLIRRPYLSEAWFIQRSAPPMIQWVDKRSAADIKEQLKFWARAVACNVRQEC